MKNSMSNFDLHAVINELTQRLNGCQLKNIFEMNDLFFFRFRSRSEGRLVLLVEPGRRLHLTKFKRDYPPKPSGLCKAFRTHIKGKWLKRIFQYDFDRVCVLEFEIQDEIYQLIIELFGKGNLILTGPNKKILVAKHYKKMRDRDIHPGVMFDFPPSSGRNFIEAKLDWVKQELEKGSPKYIPSVLSPLLNIGKTYAEEICLRAELNPNQALDELSANKIADLLNGIKNLRKTVNTSEQKPTIYYKSKKQDEVEDITPFPLQVYADYPSEHMDSMSNVLDEYFSSHEKEKVSEEELSAEAQKIEQLKVVKQKQENHLKGLKHTAKKDKKKGDLLYLHMKEVDDLIDTIMDARKNNIEWSEIKEKISQAKEKNMRGARLIRKIEEDNKTLKIKLNDTNISLNFLKNVSENANKFYENAKKAKSKIPGAKKQIEKLEERIKNLELGYEKLADKEQIMLEKRDREWYEKFHWFNSSDGFLVLAGKNQRSNTHLVKTYMEPHDLFLHADVHGASVVIIKSKGKEIPQKTIKEAAQFSVDYSSAWKDRLSTADTYWVKPEQVSFSAPSGEYLAKGSFIIEGSKNYMKNVPLSLTVAPVIEEKWAYIICGPNDAVEAASLDSRSKLIQIVPGDIPKSRMAKIIVEKFVEDLEEPDKK
ncbi:MAG: ribosome rescue protein RqcH, partial [Asgard group archaeon]|nr:ribosome rescue protein RqcH [Asgard group archaeon]